MNKCKICKKPCNGRVCCWEHAIELVNIEKVKKQKKIDKETRIRLKSRSQWLKEAQTVVNQYVRLRDENLPCISCQRHHNGQYHGGHYLSVGAHPELRFAEENIHKQCAPCNNHLSGNMLNYRVNLISKIGIEKVEWLESKHEPKKYTIPEIQEIISTYKEKIKQVKGGINEIPSASNV